MYAKKNLGYYSVFCVTTNQNKLSPPWDDFNKLMNWSNHSNVAIYRMSTRHKGKGFMRELMRFITRRKKNFLFFFVRLCIGFGFFFVFSLYFEGKVDRCYSCWDLGLYAWMLYLGNVICLEHGRLYTISGWINKNLGWNNRSITVSPFGLVFIKVECWNLYTEKQTYKKGFKKMMRFCVIQ